MNVITECIDIHKILRFHLFLKLKGVQKITHIQVIL